MTVQLPSAKTGEIRMLDPQRRLGEGGVTDRPILLPPPTSGSQSDHADRRRRRPEKGLRAKQSEQELAQRQSLPMILRGLVLGGALPRQVVPGFLQNSQFQSRRTARVDADGPRAFAQ